MAGGGEGLTGVPRRLFHQNFSLLRNQRLHRMLALAGHELRLGLPGPGDGVLVWGASPSGWRGEAVAARRGVPLVRVEDAFLRSVLPGRAGVPRRWGCWSTRSGCISSAGPHHGSSRSLAIPACIIRTFWMRPVG